MELNTIFGEDMDYKQFGQVIVSTIGTNIACLGS